MNFERIRNRKRNGILLCLLLCCFCFICFLHPLPAAASAGVTKEKLAKGTKFETTLYVIESGKKGPTVLITGGVHGNEPAGYKAAEKLTDEKISCGTLLVLPNANEIAIEKNLRAPNSTGNLNRKFPTGANGSAEGTLAKAILSVMEEYDVDWVIDLHEGVDYAGRDSSSSVGQSVIYYPSGKAKQAAERIVRALNQNISTSYRKFQLLKYPAKGSLARAGAVVCGANSMIVETCTRDKLQTRIDRQLKAVEVVLEMAGIK